MHSKRQPGRCVDITKDVVAEGGVRLPVEWGRQVSVARFVSSWCLVSGIGLVLHQDRAGGPLCLVMFGACSFAQGRE